MNAKALRLFVPVAIVISNIALFAQPAPVNPNASPEARALLKYIYSISGKYTLTGQHNYPNEIARWTERAYGFTGKYPAIYGQDFGFQGEDDKDSVLARPAIIAEVKRQWRNGAIPTLTWHAVRPISDEPVTFSADVQGKLSDFEWRELLTPGSPLNKRWCEQVDVVAGYLRQLRDEHVPVLFRPYHEMNGGWFWWGGRPGKSGSAALYRQLYDRFVNVHHLDNLIWAWNVNAPNGGPNMAVADYFPGTDVADMLTLDVYGEFKQSYYTELIALAAGKPLALGEVGFMPSPAVLKAQPNWTYFMTWSEWVEEYNTLEEVQALYNSPQALSRNDSRLSEPLAEIRKAAKSTPELATPNAAASAKALLARLYEVGGKSILSGQQNWPAQAAAATSQVTAAAKAPAIYAQELAVPKEAIIDPATARKQIVEEAKRQAKSGAIVSLSWCPPRPSDTEPAAEKSTRTPLSDYEWIQLLTPGSTLNKMWAEQVDAIAATLKQLDDAGVAVLWRPYPQANGKKFWWANRKGIYGSSALYRQLFDRLVNHHGLKNLVWVWDADMPPNGPDKSGQYADYFPGLLYADALAVNIEDGSWGREKEIALIGVGKPIGLGITGRVAAPESLSATSRWSWFIATPDVIGSPEQMKALVKLYADPRVVGSATSADAKAQPALVK